MKKTSSNKVDMINALENIKKVSVRDSLYGEIVYRISNQRIIPIHKIRAVAAVFVCLISVELYLGSIISSDYSTNDIESLVPSTSNTFYHD